MPNVGEISLSATTSKCSFDDFFASHLICFGSDMIWEMLLMMFFLLCWLCIWFDDNIVLGELCRFCHQGKQIISDLLISEARGRAFPWRCNKWDHPVRTWLQLLLVQSTIALIGAHNYKSIKTGARDLLYLQWTIGGNGSRCCKWRYCANGQDWWQHRNTLHIKT